MKKKTLFKLSLATSALAVGTAIAMTPKPAVSKAEASEEATFTSEYVDSEYSTSPSDGEASESQSASEDEIYTLDPEALAENIYDKYLKDTIMMGMTFSAFIGLCGTLLAVASTIYEKFGNKKIKLDNQSILSDMKDKLAEYKNEVDVLKDEIKANVESAKETEQAYAREIETLTQKLDEATEKLAKYSVIDDKLNAILNNQTLITSTDDYVKDGITDKVKDNVEAVK